MMRPPSARSISAAWILSGSAPRANSANARENVASEGTCERRSKAEDATQGLVDGEALDQGAGGGNAQDRLGHESSSEGATVLGRPAWPGRLGNEGFEADHVERGDDTTQRFGDRIVAHVSSAFLTLDNRHKLLKITPKLPPWGRRRRTKSRAC